MTPSLLGIDIGRKGSFTRLVTDEDVLAFSQVSGDTNPIHVDVDYAKKTRFKQRVAHGSLSASYISAALAQVTNRAVTIVYLSQNLRFRRPVFAGDTITAIAEVVSLDSKRRRAKVNTVCTNQKGEQVVVGEAEVMLDPFPFQEQRTSPKRFEPHRSG